MSWGNHTAMRCDIEAADWRGVAEEETFLLVGLNVHRDQCATRSEEDNILAWDARPLQI